MKKYILYFLLLLQVLIIATLIYLFEQIDTDGKEIVIQTKAFEYEPFIAYDNTLYVEYEINEIAEEVWSLDENLDYDTNIYVLLKKNEDALFTVSDQALENKWPDLSDDEVVLQASYGYHDEHLKTHHVRYQLEELYKFPVSIKLKQGDRLVVTWKIGKWGQSKLVDLEKVDD